ncbi:hypothetical protein P152DRAFT_329197 [Eremomyces bilateralis CBS 781.70]|uniref:Uncharacterized protein n=1 Tax=Eremomyces bilateralis CBS 781.70 TaxID=1392243 RepID=A0A6G1G4W7_9PEZI|nr:uncharacterized protein P152DRAFT_329197 [Eremomyces bilateralis CBS 781.70]KAF1812879.1 hypothetical protein P152DRAFT_329197 [Eremomyces bilateralis CBS 781.70]
MATMGEVPPYTPAVGQPLDTGPYKSSPLQRTFKTSLRSLAVTCAIIAVALQGAAFSRNGYRYSCHYYGTLVNECSYDYEGIWVSPESYTFAILSIIWNVAEFITQCVNGRGIHPGAHVGLDLIIWGGLLSAALIQLLVDYEDLFDLTIGAAAIKIILTIIHFILFVWACVDTDRRRKHKRQRLAALITQAGNQQAQLLHMQNEQHMSMYKQPQFTTYAQPPPGMVPVPASMPTGQMPPNAYFPPGPPGQQQPTSYMAPPPGQAGSLAEMYNSQIQGMPNGANAGQIPLQPIPEQAMHWQRASVQLPAPNISPPTPVNAQLTPDGSGQSRGAELAEISPAAVPSPNPGSAELANTPR